MTFPQADLDANSFANIIQTLSSNVFKSRGIHGSDGSQAAKRCWGQLAAKNPDVVSEVPGFPRCETGLSELALSHNLCECDCSKPGLL